MLVLALPAWTAGDGWRGNVALTAGLRRAAGHHGAPALGPHVVLFEIVAGEWAGTARPAPLGKGSPCAAGNGSPCAAGRPVDANRFCGCCCRPRKHRLSK